MNLELTEEQDLVIAMVRRFVREEILPLEYDLDPDADELHAADRARLIEKTKAMGLYGLDIPPAFGGPDIDLVTRTLIAVEMAQHRAGLYAPCYGTFGGAGLAQLFEATDAHLPVGRLLTVVTRAHEQLLHRAKPGSVVVRVE